MRFITEEISFTDYIDSIRRFESAWLYHDKQWLAAVREGFNAEIFGLLTRTTQGDFISLTPVMSVRKSFFRLVGSPLRGMYTEYMGPLFTQGASEEEKHLSVVSQHFHLKRMGAAYIEWGVKNGNSVQDYSHIYALRSEGYAHMPWSTFVIDLDLGLDKIWSGFQTRARNMVRKAEKGGVVVRSIQPTENDVAHYYAMLTETFQRQGKRPPHPLAFFRSICRYLAPAGLLQFMVAEKEQRVVAGALFLRHGERMVYLSGTSTAEGARLAANSLIQWSAIQAAAGNGVVEYDLGGAGVHAAIDKFKESFGGRLHTHHRWVYRSLPIRLFEPAYRILVDWGFVRLHG